MITGSRMNRRNYLRFVTYLTVTTGVSKANAGSYEDFFTAIQRDDASAIAALLGRGFDPNTRDSDGQVGLLLALRADSLNAAQALMQHPALQVDASNTAGETPLMMAALKGRLAWCRRLLDLGAALQKRGWTPLHYAASGPEPAVVKLMLDRGASVDAESPNRTTPLMMAARYGREESVDLLLTGGADVRRTNDRGLDAVEFARLGGRESLVERLAKRAGR